MTNEPYTMRDPTAELSSVIRPRLDPPEHLNGATIGLLSISKERSDEFLDTVSARLSERGHTVLALQEADTYQTSAGSHASRISWPSVMSSSKAWPIEARARRAVCMTSRPSTNAAYRDVR